MGVTYAWRKILLLLVICPLFLISGCVALQGNKQQIVSAYQENKVAFANAIQRSDYSEVELIDVIEAIYVANDYVDFQGKGWGLGSSTHYYGIFYSPDGDLCAVDVAGPREELIESGAGYQYQEINGDNRYYVEPLGNNFFYYEAHF